MRWATEDGGLNVICAFVDQGSESRQTQGKGMHGMAAVIRLYFVSNEYYGRITTQHSNETALVGSKLLKGYIPQS